MMDGVSVGTVVGIMVGRYVGTSLGICVGLREGASEIPFLSRLALFQVNIFFTVLNIHESYTSVSNNAHNIHT